MMDTLIKASHNYIYHQLRLESTSDATFSPNKYHHSTIDVIGTNGTKVASFWYSNDFIVSVSVAMLDDDQPDEATIIDLVNETTNQIVGSAKIVAAESDAEDFDIGLPQYKGFNQADDSGTLCAFHVNNTCVFQLTLEG